MDLLVFLARQAGQVVSKDQILDGVWGQHFIAESVLSRSVANLRELLEDDAGRPRFIETIPKRGYRLVARVSFRDAPAARRPSVVVLPFVDMAAGHDQDYFCDGLAEELTNGLAQLPGLRVVARTSAFAFKGRSLDVREIGCALDVGVVLEGGVQRVGDRLRVTVQLIDVADGCHLWSRRFDRPAGDIFAIEDEIVAAVVSALQVRVLDGSDPPSIAGRTVVPAAHDLYLKGRHLSARRSFDALSRAIGYFEEAIAIDPGYAAAFAAIGECRAVGGFVGYARPADAFPAARKAAERALTLDPTLAEGQAVLGHESGMYEWRWTAAEAHFRRALELSPGYALARIWYSHLLTATGRFDEAIAQTERACECDPLSPTVQTTLGLALYYAGEFERAVARYLKVLDIDPAFALARFHLGRLYAAQGRFADAAGQYEQAAPAVPLALGFLAGARRLAGQPAQAAEAVAALERMAKTRYVGPMAWMGAHAGDPEAQLQWLARAVDEREGALPLLNTDPAMNPLRALPRYQALLDRLGLPRVTLPRAAEV